MIYSQYSSVRFFMTEKVKSLSAKFRTAPALSSLKKLPKIPLTKPTKPHHYAVWTVSIIVVIFAIAAGSSMWYYHNRALPHVQLAGLSVAGKNHNQIANEVNAQANKIHISFSYQGKATTASAKDVGLNVDVDKTVANVEHAGRSHWWQQFELWQTHNVPLVTSANAGTFKDYTTKHFPGVMIDATDAKLVYNDQTKQYDIKPGTDGSGFDARKFEELLPTLAVNPRTATLAVASMPVKPLIQESALTSLQTQMNQLVQLSLRFTYQGKLIYFADPPDIADWANFSPDPTTGQVSVKFDKAKIKQFLTDKVGKTIAQPPVDRKVVKDPKTGQEAVLQQGQGGRQIQDIDSLVDKVYNAVTQNQPLETELSVTEAPFKTVYMQGTDKWIEVDLSKQQATLYTGATPIQSFIIASGVASHATEVGEFHVWYKTPSQTMAGGNKASGDYYYLPNVTWVTYFDGEEAFHTAYWLSPSQFGRPQSHGCINMTAAAAKIVYDFAPIGTKVIVHY